MGATDPAVKSKLVADIKIKKYDQIPAEAWVRLGYNDNGIWAGDDEAWETHPAKVAQDLAEATEKERERKQVTISLSLRGWGDYSPVEWCGDITRPDAEILGECKALLISGHDVDNPNQSDAEILTKITSARAHWEGAPAREAARAEASKKDIERKIASGYCFSCGTYCYGDCGSPSKNPTVKFQRDFRYAQREANYGIEDGE